MIWSFAIGLIDNESALFDNLVSVGADSFLLPGAQPLARLRLYDGGFCNS